jgi:hypothetical protein
MSITSNSEIMKNIIVLIPLFLGTTGAALAGNGESIFKNKITKKICYPASVSSESEVVVTVNLHIDAEKCIQIQLVDSNSEAMTKAIITQIQRMNLPVSEDMIGKDYTFRFVLKKQA